MILVKSSLFVLTIITIKYIFKFINDYGDKCVSHMRELIDFTDYLRVYSCDMKMSFEEIYLKYNCKSKEIKDLIGRLKQELNENEKNRDGLESYIKELLRTPEEFNKYFTDIVEYYGNTYSDVLDKKLQFTLREMENTLKQFDRVHTEKKNLNNRISILVGCLTAVILI